LTFTMIWQVGWIFNDTPPGTMALNHVYQYYLANDSSETRG